MLTDDRELIDAAVAEDARWVDLSALLLACSAELEKKAMRALVHAIELDADHSVKAATRSALGT